MRRLQTALGVAFMSTAALGALGELSACATKPAQLPQPAPVSAPACPSLRTYTPAEQKALAEALKALPPESPIAGMAVDYERLRDGTRACLASK